MIRFLRYSCAFLFLLFFLTGHAYAQAEKPAEVDSAGRADSLLLGTPYDYQTVRGLNRIPQKPSQHWRLGLHYLLFIPRTAVDLVLTSAGYSAVVLDEENVIKAFEDIFYLYDKKLGWYPVLSYVSGFSKGFGLSFFYRETYFSAALKGAYSSRDNWRTKFQMSHTFFSAPLSMAGSPFRTVAQ